MVAVCAMAGVALSDSDLLFEARAICRQVQTVWFVAEKRIDPATRDLCTVYRIYRRGMGLVASRSSPQALVSYLRKQRPSR